MAASVLQGHNDLAVVGRVPYDAGLEPMPFPCPNILLEAGNVDFIKELIRREAGIGILGTMGIEEELREGTLKAIPLDSEGFVIYIDVLLPRE